VKGSWEERFERQYGFWRGLADEAVARYLDCGVWDNEVVEDVGHAQWVFTVPKMLRVYFLHHGKLLGELSRAAAQTVKELLAAAAGEEKGFRRGVVPVPYVDERAAEELFRHKVLGLLRRRGLLSQDRIELLLSWRRSGFSVHNRVYAHPGHSRDFEALVRYMMRSPVSLTRLRFTPGAKEVVYARKDGHDASEPGEDERVDAEDFVARVLVQIPQPRRHVVRYYGAYSNRARGQRHKAEGRLEGNVSGEAEEPIPPPPERAALRRRWANLIRRVYEVDPLVCPRCGAEMRIIGSITEPKVIRRILDHIRKRDRVSRPPPPPQPAVAHIA
jgi:hypothetical protein